MASLALLATTAIDPNPIFDAAAYTMTVATTANGIRQRVAAPGAAPLDVLHVRRCSNSATALRNSLTPRPPSYRSSAAPTSANRIRRQKTPSPRS